jgi:hypothetical protein
VKVVPNRLNRSPDFPFSELFLILLGRREREAAPSLSLLASLVGERLGDNDVGWVVAVREDVLELGSDERFSLELVES